MILPGVVCTCRCRPQNVSVGSQGAGCDSSRASTQSKTHHTNPTVWGAGWCWCRINVNMPDAGRDERAHAGKVGSRERVSREALR